MMRYFENLATVIADTGRFDRCLPSPFGITFALQIGRKQDAHLAGSHQQYDRCRIMVGTRNINFTVGDKR